MAVNTLPPLEKILRAPVYYTYAYASWKKGSIEHANGLLRFRFPKGADFPHVPLTAIAQGLLNSIFRLRALKGFSAHETFPNPFLLANSPVSFR